MGDASVPVRANLIARVVRHCPASVTLLSGAAVCHPDFGTVTVTRAICDSRDGPILSLTTGAAVNIGDHCAFRVLSEVDQDTTTIIAKLTDDLMKPFLH